MDGVTANILETTGSVVDKTTTFLHSCLKYSSIEETHFFVVVGVVSPVLLVLLCYKLFFWATTVSGGRSAGKAAIGKSGVCLLCGPSGGGKTTMFQNLVGLPPRVTHTSMTPNRGTAAGMTRNRKSFSFPVVDVPGHTRLRNQVFIEAKKARCIVVLVDATKFPQGVRAAIPFVAHFFENPNKKARLVIAANKLDDTSAFSVKAIRKEFELELTGHFVAQQQAVGRAKGAVSVRVSAVDTKATAANTRIVLEEGENFSFENMSAMLGVHVEFVDVSGIENTTAFNRDPIVEMMLRD